MPQPVRGPHRQLWRQFHTGLISYCGLFKSNMTPVYTNPRSMLSAARQTESLPRVSYITTVGQQPPLHTSACLASGESVPSIYWKQLHVSAENWSMDLLDRVPRIYWKQFQLSTGNSSRYLFERVSGIYLKEFQVPTGKSSRDRLERVPVI